MEASLSFSSPPIVGLGLRTGKPTAIFVWDPKRCDRHTGNRRLRKRVSAISDPGGAVGAVEAVPVQAEVTWQIIVGAIAGTTPFVVAGIEFSKRIIAQKRCEECGGSGLLLMDQDYVRCPSCGGFLPWQSWKRFFTG